MPTLTSYGLYYTESKSESGPWSLANKGQEVNFRTTTSRSVTTRRVKPKGTDLLFDGTSYTRSTVQTTSLGVPFGPTLAAGTWYRGIHSVPWLAGSQATVYWQSAYPNIQGMELPVQMSSNDLRNLIANQKADLLTNLLEFRQTKSMFTGAAKVLLKDTSQHAQDVQKMIRRYNRVGWGIPGSSLTKRLADLHLAYVFGVRPLISDLCGSFDVLVNSDPRRVFRHKAVTGSPLQIMTKSFSGGSYMPVGSITSVVRQIKARYNYIVYGEMGPVTDWHQYAQLGLNPAATAWELVPWSFAIDRFIQIGDALTSMTALSGLTRARAYERLQVNLNSTMSHLYGEAVFKQRVNNRTPRDLSWSAPRVMNTFGANQVVTYTALLRQQLTKLSPIFK